MYKRIIRIGNQFGFLPVITGIFTCAVLFGFWESSASSSPAMFYRMGPPPGYTGGLHEPTCQDCHFDAQINPPDGKLLVKGIPDRYQPGAWYMLDIMLYRPRLEVGGFQIAARFVDTDGKSDMKYAAYPQAGVFKALDMRTAVDTLNNLFYARQTDQGAEIAEHDTIHWHVQWQAPDNGSGIVGFYVAANASNYDDSEYGDAIYLAADTVRSVAFPDKLRK